MGTQLYFRGGSKGECVDMTDLKIRFDKWFLGSIKMGRLEWSWWEKWPGETHFSHAARRLGIKNVSTRLGTALRDIDYGCLPTNEFVIRIKR